MEPSLELKNKIQDLWYMSNVYEKNLFNKIVDNVVKGLEKEIEKNRQEARTEKGHLKYFEIKIKNESIQTVLELKVVNEYKNLELFIKELIRKAFDEEEDKRLFKWNNILDFFKRKKTFLEEIDGYDEILELKHTNNALKHSLQSLTSDKDTKDIPEFKNLQSLDSESLKNFYQRLRPKVLIFVNSFTGKVVENLEMTEKTI